MDLEPSLVQDLLLLQALLYVHLKQKGLLQYLSRVRDRYYTY